MPQNCCEPPTTTTNVYDYSIPATQYVQEALTIVGGTGATLSEVPIADATVIIWINGVFQLQGTDYTIVDDAITFTEAVPDGSVVVAFFIKAE